MIVSNKLITIMFSGRNKLISANRLEDNLFSCIPNTDLDFHVRNDMSQSNSKKKTAVKMSKNVIICE